MFQNTTSHVYVLCVSQCHGYCKGEGKCKGKVAYVFNQASCHEDVSFV